MKKEIIVNCLRCGKFLLTGLLLSGMITQVVAQTDIPEKRHYISARLQLGLHTKASMDSPVKELISSGSAVEVLNSEKDFSEIKTATGVQGWIKSKFLTREEPAAVKINQLEEALQATEEKLQLQLAEASQSDQSEPADSHSELSDSKERAYKETIASLEAELKAWEQLDSQDKRAQKEQAEKNNTELKKRLSMIAALAAGKDADSIGQLELSALSFVPESEGDLKESLLKKFRKNYMFPLMFAGLGFFLGLFMMDLHSRRRHGGLRV